MAIVLHSPASTKPVGNGDTHIGQRIFVKHLFDAADLELVSARIEIAHKNALHPRQYPMDLYEYKRKRCIFAH